MVDKGEPINLSRRHTRLDANHQAHPSDDVLFVQVASTEIDNNYWCVSSLFANHSSLDHWLTTQGRRPRDCHSPTILPSQHFSPRNRHLGLHLRRILHRRLALLQLDLLSPFLLCPTLQPLTLQLDLLCYSPRPRPATIHRRQPHNQAYIRRLGSRRFVIVRFLWMGGRSMSSSSFTRSSVEFFRALRRCV